MKKIALFVSLFLVSLFLEGYAQITIGSNLPPNVGSLLDLKQYDLGVGKNNSDKGLLLPRVKLDTEIDFDPLIPGLSDQELSAHTGLIVYHVGSINLCAGVYSWSGNKWQRLLQPCQVKLVCGTATINGTYDVGVALNSSNTISLDIEVPHLSEGGKYTISTDTQNGMRFYGTGTLTKGTMHINLAGTGAPLSGGVKTVFTITANFSNSVSDPVTCRVELPANEIPIASPTILGVGSARGVYGYHLESSASKSFAAASINFGVTDQSTVKARPVVITHELTFDPLTVTNFINSAAFKSDPNIMIFSPYVTTTSQEVIDSLASYLERGGVLILQDEVINANSITFRLMKKLCPIQAGGIAYTALGGAGSVYSMTNTIDDEITNGPFGNVMGKQWGEDSSPTQGFTGLPSDSITIYSEGTYITPGGVLNSTKANAVSMFKHKRLNLFFVGDGGFISNDRNHTGSYFASRIACPFAVNTQFEPIVRTNWGYNGIYSVYNSQIFANVLGWAVKNARSNNRE